MRPIVGLILVLALPIALAHAAGDAAGDERHLLREAELPRGACDSAVADILAASIRRTDDGRIEGSMTMRDARGNVTCGGLTVPVTVTLRGVQTGVHDGVVLGVSLGAVEQRYPASSGDVFWGPCAFVAFYDGAVGHVEGAPCAQTLRGAAPDAWSIPAAGTVILRDGSMRTYAIPALDAFVQATSAVATDLHVTAHDSAQG